MTIEIDPVFDLPPIKDAKYFESVLPRQQAGTDSTGSDLEEPFALEGGEVTFEDTFDEPEAIEPPSSVTIVSQTVKISPSGQQSVDVVIEIQDVPGAASYESREAVR